MKHMMGFVSAAALLAGLAACAEDSAPAPLPPAAPPAVAAPAAPAPAAVPAHAPAIFCESPQYDFGSAESTKVITHEFVIQNKGDAVLNISAVRPSCGCTIANISTQAVPAGGEARVTANLNLSGKSGQQHKAITVDCDDPKQPQLTLLLVGNVADAVLLNPAQLIFGMLNHTSSVSAEVTVSSGNGTPFKVTGATLAMPGFDSHVAVREEGKAYAVSVSSKPPMTPGNYQAVLRITTDNPAKPSMDVLVAATVVGDLIVAPTEITLAEQPGAKATRFIVLRTSSGQTFKQPEVIAPDPAIGVAIFPFGPNGYRIQLTNLPTEKSLGGKTITIHTDIESMKEISVPIRVLTAAG